MPVHPIRTEADHDRALARIAALMETRLSARSAAELDALVTLADAYETKHVPVPSPSPVAVLEFFLDQNGLTRKDLEPMIGSRARVSEVLSGKRQLTLAMMRRLSTSLGISADLLIGNSPVVALRGNTSRKKRKPNTAPARKKTLVKAR